MNWIIKMFRDWGIKINSNPTCNQCGIGFKDHTDENLRDCVVGKK